MDESMNYRLERTRTVIENNESDGYPKSRFLSEAECGDLAARAAKLSVGGGETGVHIETVWTGNIRYARNHILSSGDVRDHPEVMVTRSIRGATGNMWTNQIEDTPLEAAIRRCERVVKLQLETGGPPFQEFFVKPALAGLNEHDAKKAQFSVAQKEILDLTIQSPEVHSRPKIFHNTTYQLDAEARAEAVRPLIALAKDAGMYAAGYVQVSAHGRAVIDTWGRALYYPYTRAQYSVTVRNPKGTGSGWAGVDWADWSRVDTMKLTEIALDKCLRSQNPVAVEPGRYTAILEPQAVHALISAMIHPINIFNRKDAEENGTTNPWFLGKDMSQIGLSKIGLKVLDERVTIMADSTDAELGFPPFDLNGNVYHPSTWIKNGVLVDLPYSRSYAIEYLGINKGMPNSRAYRMLGGESSIEEMIETTKRGVLVTRFTNIQPVEGPQVSRSILLSGYTRDGLWLVENGKISKAIKNFRFVDSPLFAFNNLEQLGESVRVFSPEFPAFAPSAKVRDFSFNSLTDAI